MHIILMYSLFPFQNISLKIFCCGSISKLGPSIKLLVAQTSKIAPVNIDACFMWRYWQWHSDSKRVSARWQMKFYFHWCCHTRVHWASILSVRVSMGKVTFWYKIHNTNGFDEKNRFYKINTRRCTYICTWNAMNRYEQMFKLQHHIGCLL